MVRFVSWHNLRNGLVKQPKMQPFAALVIAVLALSPIGTLAMAAAQQPAADGGAVQAAKQSALPDIDQQSELPSLDELLARDAGVDYDQSKRCLPLHKVYEVNALDENHIVFELHGDRYYLVQLERRCPGLRPQNAVAYEHRSSRLCAMDSVRGVGVTGGFSPSCQLGRFQPVSEEQIALLEEALKQRAMNPTHRGKPLKDSNPNPNSLPQSD